MVAVDKPSKPSKPSMPSVSGPPVAIMTTIYGQRPPERTSLEYTAEALTMKILDRSGRLTDVRLAVRATRLLQDVAVHYTSNKRGMGGICTT